MRSLFPALLLVSAFAVPALGADEAPEAILAADKFADVSQERLAKLEAMHEQAAKRLEDGRPREAVFIYTEILLLEPDDDAAYTNLGQAYLMLGDAREARDAFLNALHIDPDNEVALAGLKNVADPDGTIASGELSAPEED